MMPRLAWRGRSSADAARAICALSGVCEWRSCQRSHRSSVAWEDARLQTGKSLFLFGAICMRWEHLLRPILGPFSGTDFGARHELLDVDGVGALQGEAVQLLILHR